MSDTLEIFGMTYPAAEGIKAYDSNGNLLTFVKDNIPKFTFIYDNESNWNIVSATCNKTYSECVAMYNNGSLIGANEVSSMADSSSSWSTEVFYGEVKKEENKIIFTSFISGQALYDIVYHSNGSIDFIDPSSYQLELEVAQNGTYYPQEGAYIGVRVNVPTGTPRTSSDLTVSGATVTAPAGFYSSDATKTVASGSATTPATTITANPSISVSSSGLITATASATQSVTPTVSAGYVSSGTSGTVTVSGSNTSQLTTQAGSTITPTESVQTAVSSGKYTTGDVKIGAISSTYVGSGIAQNDSNDLTVSGATVTAPAGYYATSASKSVASGTAGTPSASKGTVSNHQVSVTPSVTNTTGYITGGTKTGTAVTVSASELVSGTLSITSSGTKDVTNYASASVTAGTEGTPSATKGTVSNHQVSITPSVTNSAGYITGGTKTGTAVTVTASELASGNKAISQNGTNIDVVGYSTVSVDVPTSAAAISVVDTTDSNGGTVRTITALDISDTTAVASDVASGKYFYTASGVKTAGTGSGSGGGAPSATAHTIYFEFSDNTNTTITAYYDDSFISSAITVTTPTTYNNKTVTLAQLDGTTWYSYSPSETWDTVYNGTAQVYADSPYPYFYLSSLSNVSIPVGSVWRVTLDGVESRLTATNSTYGGMLGNPLYSGGSDDGSGLKYSLFNAGWGAWSGGADLTPGVDYSLKIERLVTS